MNPSMMRGILVYHREYHLKICQMRLAIDRLWMDYPMNSINTGKITFWINIRPVQIKGVNCWIFWKRETYEVSSTTWYVLCIAMYDTDKTTVFIAIWPTGHFGNWCHRMGQGDINISQLLMTWFSAEFSFTRHKKVN